MPDFANSGDPGWDLAVRVKNGEPLVLTSRVIAILRRSAREVGIDKGEVDAGLRSVKTATALLTKISVRIRKNSWRLMRALNRMYKLRDAGDLEGARKQMRDVLAVDPDPHHRKIAQGQLDHLDDWKPPKGKAPKKKTASKPRKTGANRRPPRARRPSS